MKFIAYIFAYAFVWLLHLLPERILFLLSDLLYLLMYHVAGYRKKVVYTNLEKAFPEYEKSEIRRIAKKFFHHLSKIPN
jgi:KDO2-lipid IV(A) lauroyltransferase